MPQIPDQIKQPVENPETKWGQNLQQSLKDYSRKLAEILNKGLRILDNMSQYDGSTTTPATPDEEFSFNHALKRTPIGYWVISIDKAAIVYNGATAWDSEYIYLKCNVATTAIRVIVF